MTNKSIGSNLYSTLENALNRIVTIAARIEEAVILSCEWRKAAVAFSNTSPVVKKLSSFVLKNSFRKQNHSFLKRLFLK